MRKLGALALAIAITSSSTGLEARISEVIDRAPMLTPLEFLQKRELADSLLSDGQELSGKGEYAKAIKVLNDSLRNYDAAKETPIDLEIVEVRLALGIANYELGKLHSGPQKKDIFKVAEKELTISEKLYNEYVLIYPTRAGDSDIFQTGLKINSALGNLYLGLGDITKALKYGLKVLKIYPSEDNVRIFVDTAAKCPADYFATLRRDIVFYLGKSSSAILERIEQARKAISNTIHNAR